MLNKKKGLAMLLAATMVVGSAFPVLAAEQPTSGSTTGTGTSEGHVEKKLTNVILPTVAADSSPFAYTMDPEGLISGTGVGIHDGATFPAAASDTGVYFLTDTNKYENTSKALTVTNQSSHDIKLKVKAEIESSQATDIPLVAKDALAAATDASLYLGLIVGTDEGVAITTANAVEKEVTLAGDSKNFKVAVKTDKSGYEYRVLTLDEYKALDGNSAKEAIEWSSTTFKLEGQTTKQKDITATTTAPSVKVTWSWTDPAAAPTDVAPSIAVTEYNYDRTATFDIVTDFGKGDLAATSISSVKLGTDGTTFETDLTSACIISGNTITFPSGKLGAATVGSKRYVQVTFDKGTPITLTLTVTN